MARPDLARIGAAIGDPARAAILTALLGGEILPAGELAMRAGVSSSTASGHLAHLLESGFVRCIPTGRHRYYGLANAQIASILETLGAIAPLRKPRTLATSMKDDALRFARTCWDHLAGHLGVAISEALVEQEIVYEEAGSLSLTPTGKRRLANFGIDVNNSNTKHRAFISECVDWSERRVHFAGALGAELAHVCFSRGWIQRIPGDRALRVTDAGAKVFAEAFGLRIDMRAKRILKLGPVSGTAKVRTLQSV